MPQMMPLMWTSVSIFLTTMMLTLTSFLYFFFMPSPNFHYNEIHTLNLKQINKKIFEIELMMNLFSIFDPASSPSLSMNWLSMMIFLFMLPYQFWFSPSRVTYTWNLFINFMFKTWI